MTEPMKWPESFQKALADRVAKERPWSSRNARRDEFVKAAIAEYAMDETEALAFADAMLKEDGICNGGK